MSAASELQYLTRGVCVIVFLLQTGVFSKEKSLASDLFIPQSSSRKGLFFRVIDLACPSKAEPIQLHKDIALSYFDFASVCCEAI